MINLFWADECGLPANDRGLAYGDGLFETIRMEGVRGALLARHLERMSRDAGRLGIAVSRNELKEVCAKAAERFSGRYQDGWVLKLLLTRGAGGRGYRSEVGMRPNLLVSGAVLPPPVSPLGVAVDLSRVALTVHPLFVGIKSLNRLEQVMASREINDSLFEVVMSNHEGHLVEGTRTNLILKIPDGWITPPKSSLAVAGVMRQWVLDSLHERGESIVERPLTMADVLDPGCRGLFLLNSVQGVVPVREFAGHHLPVDSGLATICNLLETLE
ncbi:MAG TPA: aminotransferase class IV [Marinobacter sp.]|nr:aminotransferase class IV [Marinobacter sp.]